MNGVSLFSGAGGIEIGFARAGIQTVLQAESDPWCLSVLARHWPDVERVTDVRQVDAATLQGRRRNMVSVGASSDADWLRDARRWGDDSDSPDLSGERVRDSRVRRGGQHAGRSNTRAPDAVDLVYGGWPCQGNSVAGKRGGLSDERSGLWHEVRRVLSELRPRWFVGENVPGLLSVCSCAACVLTKEWAAKHNAERARSKRAGSCGCAECSAGQELRRSHSGRDFGHVLSDLDDLGYGVAWRTLDARWFGVPQRRRRVFLVGCLGDARRAAQVLAVCESCGGHPPPRGETGQGVAADVDDCVAFTLPSTHRGIGNGWNTNHVAVANTLGAGGHSTNPLDETLIARALTTSNERLDFETENFVLAQNGSDIQVGGELGALTSGMARQTSGDLIAFSNRGNATAGAERLRAGSHGAIPMAGGTAGVRRLTPLECERLQGWPDEWTRWAADGKEIPDSHRYRMVGNGVASVCAEWIGHRLVAVDRVLRGDGVMGPAASSGD